VEAAVHTWTTIVSLPLCAALTAAGLVLSWFTWRRRGARRGIRAAAWSLLPLAAYLTGTVPMFWRIGSAIANFAQGFAFSPRTWLGLILFGLSLVILLASGGIPLLTRGRKRGKQKELKPSQGARATTTTSDAAALPASAPRLPKRGKGSGDDDGLDADVAQILRRHGIS
jgi:hypothetical protein